MDATDSTLKQRAPSNGAISGLGGGGSGSGSGIQIVANSSALTALPVTTAQQIAFLAEVQQFVVFVPASTKAADGLKVWRPNAIGSGDPGRWEVYAANLNIEAFTAPSTESTFFGQAQTIIDANGGSIGVGSGGGAPFEVVAFTPTLLPGDPNGFAVSRCAGDLYIDSSNQILYFSMTSGSNNSWLQVVGGVTGGGGGS